jgi:drug/metabolite transporter (DMT)-like permease
MMPRWNNLPGNLRGAVLMSLAAMLFAGEALAIRYMNERGIPTAMQLFARSFGQLLWVMPLLLQSGLAVFRTNRRGLHILRGTASLLTWGFYYLSFAFLDLATATV